MRVSLLIAVVSVAGCSNAEDAGRAAAQKQAELEAKAEVVTAAPTISPPVPGHQHIPCATLIDTAAFTEALAEPEAMTTRDDTSSDADAAAVCGVVRGGVRPDQAQQGAIIKKTGKLGVLPGDEVCQVTAYCWTLENDARFHEKCKTDGFTDDQSLGTYACLQVVGQGANDVNVYKFLDEDTNCVLKVRGGPSMVDNAVIASCAKAARDLIGKTQITPGVTPPQPSPTPGTTRELPTPGTTREPGTAGSATP